MSKKKMLSPVSARAIQQRINRKLAARGETLKKCPVKSQWFSDLGGYYCVNTNHNHLTSTHIDLEEMGRELGVLAEWETVIDG